MKTTFESKVWERNKILNQNRLAGPQIFGFINKARALRRSCGSYTFPKVFLISLLIWNWPVTGFSQAVLGAREVSLGQSGTALYDSRWSVFGNPAMMGSGGNTVSFFGIRYYGFTELTDMAAATSLSTGMGVIGAGAYRYGDDLFSESKIRLAYKNSFQGFHYGAVVNYNHVSIGGGYGSAGAIGIDAGLGAVIVPGLWLGGKATNVNRPAYGRSDEELPRELSVGLSYDLSDKALFIFDMVKDVRFPLSWRGGVEITIIDHLQGRAGITTNPRTFSLGFGYNRDLWGVNVVVQQHENPVLGLSPGFDLSLSF